MRLGEEVKFLENRLTPDWFLDMNKNLIQLVAPVNLVKERREKDSSRKRQSDIVQILKHQKLCSEEWERIARKSVLTSSKMHVIENVDLNKAVNEIENIIYERDNIKSNRNEFIQRLKYQVTPIGDEKNNSLICTRKTDVSKNVKEERDGR